MALFCSRTCHVLSCQAVSVAATESAKKLTIPNWLSMADMPTSTANHDNVSHALVSFRQSLHSSTPVTRNALKKSAHKSIAHTIQPPRVKLLADGLVCVCGVESRALGSCV